MKNAIQSFRQSKIRRWSFHGLAIDVLFLIYSWVTNGFTCVVVLLQVAPQKAYCTPFIGKKRNIRGNSAFNAIRCSALKRNIFVQIFEI
jgi:hypothetical protein